MGHGLPTYVAVGCSHTFKTCKLRRFPADEAQAKKWEVNIRRDNWRRKPHHRLCICHFTDDQFYGEDRRLESFAVPTKFPTHVVRYLSKTSTRRTPSVQVNNGSGSSKDHPVTSPDHVITVRVTSPKKGSNSKSHDVAAGQVHIDHPYATFVDDLIPTNLTDDNPNVPDSSPDNAPEECMDSQAQRHNVESSNQSPTNDLDRLLQEFQEQLQSLQKESEKKVRRKAARRESPLNSLSVKLEECRNQFQSLKEELHQSQKNLDERNREYWRLKKECQDLKQQVNTFEENHSFFNPDQIEKLKRKKVKKWSRETMKEALQIRYAVGVSGYSFLLKKRYPLPSYSALCKRLKKLPLKCGVSTKVLEYMGHRQASLRRKGKFCTISIDEMEIQSKREFDKGSNQIYGMATLGDTTQVAKKLLLLVVRGITVKWKQVIGWHLTSSANVTGEMLWDFVKEGIQGLEAKGFRVESLSSDMGGSNRGIWRMHGVRATRYGKAVCKIKHPVRPNAFLYVFADFPHLLKNLKCALHKRDFYLSQSFCHKNNIPHYPVSMNWVHRYVDLQNQPDVVMRPVPKLRKCLKPTHWSKMRVGEATLFFSDKVIAAMQTEVDKGNLSKCAIPTIWFLKQVNHWWQIVTSRYIKSSLTKKNFNKKKEFLLSFVELMKELRTADRKWKPFQTGFIISSLNVIDLAQQMLFEEGLRFFLSSRLTQDAVENIFSILRRRGGLAPTPLNVLRAVRLLIFAQLSIDVKRSNYENDKDTYNAQFLSPNEGPVKRKNAAKNNGPPAKKSLLEKFEVLSVDNPNRIAPDTNNNANLAVPIKVLQSTEEEGLRNFLGSLIKKLSSLAICEKCKVLCQSGKPSDNSFIAHLNKGGLKFPSNPLFTAASIMEAVASEKMKLKNHVVVGNIGAVKDQIVAESLLQVRRILDVRCDCKFLEKFVQKFVSDRLYFALNVLNAEEKEENKQAKVFSSKTVKGVLQK